MIYITNMLSFLDLHNLCIAMLLIPLISSLIMGFFGKYFKNQWISKISILTMSIIMLITSYFLWKFFIDDAQSINNTWYIWAISGDIQFKFGFLLDKLSVIMLFTVNIISLVVCIYSINYMKNDLYYAKFFSYISFFVFAMFLLISANNFLQLFAGWELVGLVSYLLIGFWYTKKTARLAAFKAFLINRIGDVCLLLGIAAIFCVCNSLDYVTIFKFLPKHLESIDLISILLFIGVLAKSAQIPLHVWLPDAMEAPTPASALIHAATMVTAGVFLIARLSPIFEHSEYCLNIILLIGSVTAILMGILATIEIDMKRILAYSTISQLGVMFAAMGVSAYATGMFHLITHAFFKALLFLGVGSIMMFVNQEQNINNLPYLKKYLPITYWCMLIGCLAMSGFPGFSGFFSKNLILNTVAISSMPFAKMAYHLLLINGLVTAFYSFRLFFLAFNNKAELNVQKQLKKPSKLTIAPLIFLSVCSIFIGALLLCPTLNNKLLGDSIVVLPNHNVINEYVANDFPGIFKVVLYAFANNSGLLIIFGILSAFVLYVRKPHLPVILKQILQNDFLLLYNFFQHKYFFNEINQLIFRVTGVISKLFSNVVEQWLIEKLLINNFTQTVIVCSRTIQKWQTGYLYHYLFYMLTGVLIILLWLLFNIY